MEWEGCDADIQGGRSQEGGKADTESQSDSTLKSKPSADETWCLHTLYKKKHCPCLLFDIKSD